MTTENGVHAEDFYQRLGVADVSVPIPEIRQAYRKLLRRYPPERFPEEFKRIREAYETLSNSESRSAYDRRPDPAADGPLQRGLRALASDDHQAAERYFKQALLLSPNTPFVRNLLGLAIAYQGRFEQALEQFQQIVGLPDASAAWHGNMGHTLINLERFEEARHAFENAVATVTGGDSPVSYVVGLADALCGLNRYREASHVLEKAILEDGTVDFEDLDYFVKLLHVNIRARRADDVRHTLLRMKELPVDDEQARLLAYKVGSLSRQLLRAGLFDYAYGTAVLARDLQPTDGDYDALVQLSGLLHHKESGKARQLVAHHPSFREGGWLANIPAWMEEADKDTRMYGGITSLKSAPTLYTINGIGTTLYGERDVDPENGSYSTTLYFTILFIPIFPLGRYRVMRTGHGMWRFLGKLPWSSHEKWFAGIALAVLVVFILGSGSSHPRFTQSSGSAGIGSGASQSRGFEDPFPSNTMAPTSSQSVDTERAQLEARKAELLEQQAEIDRLGSEMEEIDRQTDQIEAGTSYLSTADFEYGQLIDRYNRLVGEYNSALEAFRADADRLESDIDAYNRFH